MAVPPESADLKVYLHLDQLDQDVRVQRVLDHEGREVAEIPHIQRGCHGEIRAGIVAFAFRGDIKAGSEKEIGKVLVVKIEKPLERFCPCISIQDNVIDVGTV